jgi:Na+/citrate or Na+/malate symporter
MRSVQRLKETDPMFVLLWIAAVSLFVAGIVSMTERHLVQGVILMFIGLVVGPLGSTMVS